jgi:hypothetical protein
VHEGSSAEDLELDRIGAGIGCHFDEIQCAIESAIVVDADFGDHQGWLTTAYHTSVDTN